MGSYNQEEVPKSICLCYICPSGNEHCILTGTLKVCTSMSNKMSAIWVEIILNIYLSLIDNLANGYIFNYNTLELLKRGCSFQAKEICEARLPMALWQDDITLPEALLQAENILSG